MSRHFMQIISYYLYDGSDAACLVKCAENSYLFFYVLFVFPRVSILDFDISCKLS